LPVLVLTDGVPSVMFVPMGPPVTTEMLPDVAELPMVALSPP
jgi:hypothetical protein